MASLLRLKTYLSRILPSVIFVILHVTHTHTVCVQPSALSRRYLIDVLTLPSRTKYAPLLSGASVAVIKKWLQLKKNNKKHKQMHDKTTDHADRHVDRRNSTDVLIMFVPHCNLDSTPFTPVCRKHYDEYDASSLLWRWFTLTMCWQPDCSFFPLVFFEVFCTNATETRERNRAMDLSYRGHWLSRWAWCAGAFAVGIVGFDHRRHRVALLSVDFPNETNRATHCGWLWI